MWSPGEHLVIDWGVLGGLHVFCAVLAWCRVRFVRFALDERAETTLALLAECFETSSSWARSQSMSVPPGGAGPSRDVPSPAGRDTDGVGIASTVARDVAPARAGYCW